MGLHALFARDADKAGYGVMPEWSSGWFASEQKGSYHHL
jgi:hypothetical protein